MFVVCPGRHTGPSQAGWLDFGKCARCLRQCFSRCAISSTAKMLMSDGYPGSPVGSGGSMSQYGASMAGASVGYGGHGPAQGHALGHGAHLSLGHHDGVHGHGHGGHGLGPGVDGLALPPSGVLNRHLMSQYVALHLAFGSCSRFSASAWNPQGRTMRANSQAARGIERFCCLK